MTLERGSIVAGYFRDSGGVDQERSIDQQIDVARQYCQARGLLLPDSLLFIDRALSGKSTEHRAEFHRMLGVLDAKPAPCAGILLWSSARFARNLNDSQFYKSTLRRAGYTLVFLSGDLPEEAGPLSAVLEAVTDWKNEQYLADLRKEVSRGLAWVARQGAWTGRAPRGYVKVRKQLGVKRDGSPRVVGILEVDEQLAPLVRRAFELRVQGASYDDIHRETHLFVRDHSSHYGRLLRNPVYKGVRVHVGQTLETGAPAIVDPDLWERAQLVNKERTARQGIHHPRSVGTTRYLLTGMAVCAKCGRPMYCSNMQGHHERKDGTRKVYRYPYYRCSGRYGGHCGAMNAARKVEQAVLRQIYNDVLTPEAIARAEGRQALREQGGAEARASLLQDRRARLAQLEREVANLVVSARRSPLSDALASALADVEAEAAAVRAELELADRLPAAAEQHLDLRALASDVEGALAFDDPQRARRAVQSLVRRVVMGPGSLHIDYRETALF